jgi:hypothetical protein
MENQENQKGFTPEEMEAKRKEMLKFYKDSLPYLEAQLQYEEMLFKIDEVRFKRTGIQVQYGMMMNQVQNEENNGLMEDDEREENIEQSIPEPRTTERKLKREV